MPRQAVSFDIAYDKSESRIQKITDKAPKAKFYFSDDNLSYRNYPILAYTLIFMTKATLFLLLKELTLTFANILLLCSAGLNVF